MSAAAGGRRFPSPPPKNVVREFQEFTKRTKVPETYPLLAHDPPDKHAVGHVLVCHVYVPRWQRPNEDFVPCAACGERPKFSHGWLVWSPDGELRLVGSCCGPKYFGASAFRDMERAATDSGLEEINQDLLIAHLTRIPELIAQACLLRPAAETYVRQKKLFIRGVPQLASALSKCWRDSAGPLIVSVRRSEVSRTAGPQGYRSAEGGESEFESVTVGTLSGEGFLERDFTCARQLDQLIVHLKAFKVSENSFVTEDDALSAVCELDRRQLAMTVSAFRKVLRDGVKLHAKLKHHSQFLSLENLDCLKRWCEHPANVRGFSVAIHRETALFRETLGGYASLKIGNIANVPELVGFDPI